MRQNPGAMTTAAAVPGCPVDESFDPLSPEFLADPYAVMARLPGGKAPVFFAPSIGYYVVTSYDAVDAVFRDPATYSAAVAQAPLAPIVPEAQQILLAAATSRSQAWSAWTSPNTPGSASPPPGRSA